MAQADLSEEEVRAVLAEQGFSPVASVRLVGEADLPRSESAFSASSWAQNSTSSQRRILLQLHPYFQHVWRDVYFLDLLQPRAANQASAS